MRASINVALVGFSAFDAAKLERILKLTRTRVRSYFPLPEREARACDIIMADADDENAVWRALALASKYARARLVLVGTPPRPFENAHFIAKPLIGTRIIIGLDALAGPAATGPRPAPASRPAAPAPQEAIHKAAPPPAQAAAEAAIPAPAGREPELRVLVVDDSPLIHKDLESNLSQIPHPVAIDFAHSGEEALEHITRGHAYDLIFLDIVMPGMDGYETCKQIRKEPRYQRRKPIIMLSSKSSPAEQLHGFAAGCTNFLTKPIVPAEFQKMLNRVTSWVATHRAAS